MNYISHFQHFTGFFVLSFIYYMSETFSSENVKSVKKLKIFVKRFGSLKIVRTFAIPKQSGGGEMVDTLLWGGSGSNPVRVRVSPTAPQRKEENRKVFLFFILYPFINNTKSRLICIKSSKIFNIEDMSPEFAFKSLNLDYIEDLTWFPRHDRHKADRAALGLSCGVCFDAFACAFASAGASSMFADKEAYRPAKPWCTRKLIICILWHICVHQGYFEWPLEHINR